MMIKFSILSYLALILGIGLLSETHVQARRPAVLSFSAKELDRIGNRIWKNECAGTVEGLTSWNKGEDFASLGIGHFIWYPVGETGPFEESFPSLVQFIMARGVPTPGWLQGACPWPNREVFLRDANAPRQRELRHWLASTVREQTLFIIQRLHRAEPKFARAAGRAHAHVTSQMQLLRQSAAGNFAMIDYVNFKGEGLNPKERYQGQGWGLLQVLLEMRAGSVQQAPQEFARASERILARRVHNSPPQRGEQRWMQGWANRCRSYAKPF